MPFMQKKTEHAAKVCLRILLQSKAQVQRQKSITQVQDHDIHYYGVQHTVDVDNIYQNNQTRNVIAYTSVKFKADCVS